ncbi:MAG: HAD family hydrolase [Alphaproteobacteria bacterium]|nr:HAD family hydrolase [Alphaproteobacteria bacterium]
MVNVPLVRPRAVLFDWDNTLVDTWPCIHAALNATFRAMGHPEQTFDEFRASLGPSMRDSFPQTFGDRWMEARDVFYASFAAVHLQMLRVMPGAESLLVRLREWNLYAAIVSNKIGDHLRQEVEHLGWGGHFGRIVGALDAERDKPAADPAVMALAGSGIEPGEHVWFVGDGFTDMECAHASGCLPVLVRASAPEEGEFGTHPPRRHVADCQGVADLLHQALTLPPASEDKGERRVMPAVVSNDRWSPQRGPALLRRKPSARTGAPGD